MLAVLSDIHGNLPAFEAVVAHARARGAERFLLCGDYAALGPWPVECVELAESLEPVAMLRGNHERWLTDRSDVPDNPALHDAIAWETERLEPQVRDRLVALPPTATLDGTLYCHASPSSDMESFLPDPDEQRDAELLDGATAPRVVFGHFHIQFRRVHGDTELVAPGSVGLPFDGDRRAAYATIDRDGAVALHRVIYDHRITLAALGELGEWGDWIAGSLQNARF